MSPSMSPVAIGHGSPRLNKYKGVGVALLCVLLQAVEKTIQMNTCSCINVSSDHLVCVVYISHVFLCTHFTREPENAITGKCQIRDFYARRG